MLDEYCNKLSDEAQLQIAIRLCRAALPIWNDHMAKHPDALIKLNSLIGEENRVQGSLKQIDVNFPFRALQKIEQSYILAGELGGKAVPRMKKDLLLQPLFATSLQPLTNPKWDDTLPRPVRLVFTSIWNILTWIVFRRRNDMNETHIYLAINQAADVLMSEKLLSSDQIEKILLEFKSQVRGEGEDAEWENATSANTDGTGGRTNSMDDIYRKIIGEKIIKDHPEKIQAREVLRQMREEDKSYWNKWDEYYTGTCKTYSYNRDKKSYWLSEADVVVGSFFNEYAMTEKDMLDFISGVSLDDLRESGFEI